VLYEAEVELPFPKVDIGAGNIVVPKYCALTGDTKEKKSSNAAITFIIGE